MFSYVQIGRGKELISFCKERFDGEETALMFEMDNPDRQVFIRTYSEKVISAISERFSIEEGMPGFKELYFWKWMKIGRGEWFDNNINLHFSNAS